MNGAYKFIISTVFGVILCHISACATIDPKSTYEPDDLWKLTSCDTPLIVRHKTKDDITALDKVSRLKAIGLSLYDGSSNGTDFSGKSVTYTDTLIEAKSCAQKDITIHYVTSFADHIALFEAKRDVQPIYVRHMKSKDIRRDKHIHCQGVFNDDEKQLRRVNPPRFVGVYNEELCWES